MKRAPSALSPSALRSVKTFWARLLSSTTASGHTSRSTSSLSTTRSRFWTSSSSVSKAFGVRASGSPSRSSRRLAGSSRNGPNTYVGTVSIIGLE